MADPDSARTPEPGTTPPVANQPVIHPFTGELYEHLDQQPPERLAALALAIQHRQKQFKDMGALVETELRRRLELRGRTSVLFGEYQVDYKPARESVWDWAELEGVLGELVDQGTLKAAELTGIVRHETTGSRQEAKRLAGRLVGDAKRMVEACCTWRDKGNPKLTITQLEPVEQPLIRSLEEANW